MTFIDFLTVFLIVSVCAMIAQAVFNFRKGGLIISAILGSLGAFIGIATARVLELPDLFTVQVGPETVPILWSIMGSGIFAILLSMILRRA